ncbi:ABC-three component system protein [Candidatus Poriferisodalis sp.]|uniref:ABC-three component system protein n=1 Tax=Candidatus Poriferisodalis sp. TaxID=3101277 RepID=UPI003D09F2DB
MSTERAAWRMHFRLAYAEKQGSEFESFVRIVLELAFPGDFLPVAAAGSEGDRKCDGLLPSQRRFFQAYAPKHFNKRDLLKKLEDDYNGAIEHWGGRFDTWTFIHNSREGLPPYALAFLHNASESSDSHHVCEPWGYGPLMHLVMGLSDEDLADLLGPPLRPADFLVIEIADIVQLLSAIEDIIPAEIGQINPVPHDKLERNQFDPISQDYLLQAMRHTNQVRRYLVEQVARPTYRDDLAARFASKYRSLRNVAFTPDEVITELQAWILPPVSSLKRQAAAGATIAYFFEECDIFENPEEMKQ